MNDCDRSFERERRFSFIPNDGSDLRYGSFNGLALTIQNNLVHVKTFSVGTKLGLELELYCRRAWDFYLGERRQNPNIVVRKDSVSEPKDLEVGPTTAIDRLSHHKVLPG